MGAQACFVDTLVMNTLCLHKLWSVKVIFHSMYMLSCNVYKTHLSMNKPVLHRKVNICVMYMHIHVCRLFCTCSMLKLFVGVSVSGVGACRTAFPLHFELEWHDKM